MVAFWMTRTRTGLYSLLLLLKIDPMSQYYCFYQNKWKKHISISVKKRFFVQFIRNGTKQRNKSGFYSQISSILTHFQNIFKQYVSQEFFLSISYFLVTVRKQEQTHLFWLLLRSVKLYICFPYIYPLLNAGTQRFTS